MGLAHFNATDEMGLRTMANLHFARIYKFQYYQNITLLSPVLQRVTGAKCIFLEDSYQSINRQLRKCSDSLI